MNIFTSSPWLHTGIGQTKPHVGNCGPGAGMIRYNTNSQTMEVFDGISWIALYNQLLEISTTGETDVLLHWVKEKMQEETKIKKMSEEHPAVKVAYENFQKAADQLKTTIILSQDDKTTS